MKENLKQISVRLDPIILNQIDAIQQRHEYWKRNTIINALLKCVVTEFTSKQIYDMIRRDWYSKSECRADFEILSFE